MDDVMIDLETMGNGPRAAIVAIGAVRFSPEHGTISEPFYRVVDLASSVALGGEMDADTVMWWMRQDDSARFALMAEDRVDLAVALMEFSMWMGGCGTVGTRRVWGNGAAFDNVILASAYRAAGQAQPWHFWNDRCYRTIKAQRPDVEMERVRVHHNAADDAESQARHMIEMFGGDWK